jgi:helix-turn-helix resolvase-like protein/resolvase-like protein
VAITDDELEEMERRTTLASPGPWEPRLETRWGTGRESCIDLNPGGDWDDELYFRYAPTDRNSSDTGPDPMSKMFFNMLAVFVGIEADLLKMRTREGMAVARSKGKLKDKKPKLTARQQTELVRMRASGAYSIADLMEMFSVGRATVYRVLDRAGHGRAGEAT